MEEMLGQQMRPPIVLADFLSDYKQTLNMSTFPQTDAEIQQALGLTENSAKFEDIAEKCDLEQLSQIDDARVTKYMPGFSESYRKPLNQIPMNALKLQLFAKLLKHKENAQSNPFKRTHESFKSVQVPFASSSESDLDLGLNYYDDLLITVRVYRPARATHIGRSLEKPVFAEEIACLGSNLLSELRDKISCICNKKRFFDISENPTAPLMTKETDPGYFFITDTFYNDMRNADNADYSETVRNWAKSATGLKHLKFKVAQMEETRFLDLTVSLGFPQLYQHHGNCEHVFTFSQVELLTASSTPGNINRSEYPRVRSLNMYNNRICQTCGLLHYVYIVEHSNKQIHDPAYLCTKCFRSYHYVDGKKVGEFKAYRVREVSEQADYESASAGSSRGIVKSEPVASDSATVN